MGLGPQQNPRIVWDYELVATLTPIPRAPAEVEGGVIIVVLHAPSPIADETPGCNAGRPGLLREMALHRKQKKLAKETRSINSN